MITINNESSYKLSIPNLLTFISKAQSLVYLNNWLIEITFCDLKMSQSVNNKHLSHNYPTDIITFDLSDEHHMACDIYICVKIAELNAKTYNVSLDNEVKRLIIHGFLHLKGFNDQSQKEKESMYKEQEKIVEQLHSTPIVIDL